MAQLEDLRDEVGHGGAAGHAAEYILGTLEGGEIRPPRPHFLEEREGVEDAGSESESISRAALAEPTDRG